MTTEFRNKKTIDYSNQNEKHNRFREATDGEEDEVTREYYTSNEKVVRNGVYGTVYPFNNGTHETSQLFRVIDATGRCDSSGIRLKNKKVNKSSNLVYYNSPAEYMEHRKVNIDAKVVERWAKRIQDIEEKCQENHDVSD